MLRLVLALIAVLLVDWAPGVPPFPLHGVAQVKAQAPYPPNAFHPYRGGVNCIQVADVNGFFNCSPLVTINPTTGAFSALGGSGPFSPVFGALVIAPTGNTLQALGNDLVIAKAPTGTAPAGPGVGAITLRVRPSPIVPGYCRLVIVAGNSFQEWPIAILAGNYPAFGVIGGVVNNGAMFSDYFTVDIPGGNSGC